MVDLFLKLPIPMKGLKLVIAMTSVYPIVIVPINMKSCLVGKIIVMRDSFLCSMFNGGSWGSHDGCECQLQSSPKHCWHVLWWSQFDGLKAQQW